MGNQQIDKNHNFFVGDEICVVRFKCNLVTLSDMLASIKYLEGNSTDIATSFTIKHFNYQKGNKREIETIYNENQNSKEFFEFNRKEKFIVSSNRENFHNADKDKKIIIWEPIFLSEKAEIEKETKEKTDVANFQYFMLALRYFEENGYRYSICISAGKSGDNIYTPIDYGEKWSRLRMLLYLYSLEELSKIYIYGKYKKSKEKVEEIRWGHVRAERALEDLSNVGKIFPLVSITPEVYKALVQTKCTKEGDGEKPLDRFYGLYEIYRNRFLQKKYGGKAVNESLIEENGFDNFKNDSLLEGLIFVSTLTYLEDKTLTDKKRRKDLTRLHEICVDYAQGIAQLMENIVFHVIKSKSGGCGSFTFRIRNKKEAFYHKEKDKKLNFSNFMELYVADFNYGTFNGLVSKFVENVQNREKSEVVWSDKLTTSSVKLPHLFGENLQGTLMESYFTDGNNIAMHYGLQILNSVVITGEGCLYVASGSPSDKRLDATNSFFNEYKRSSYFQPDFLWKNGTAYIIYLPIKHEEIVNYGDVIAVSNEKCEQRKTDCIALTVSPKVWETVAATADQKARDVDTAVGELSKQIKKKKFSYIDISCVTTNHIYAYEVLSKAVFLLLNEEKLKDIALINIPNEYDVIKIFRQFALFYDRKGKSAGMQDKSVYFIDADGALDLLLYGDRMDSIKENLAYGKIYGGYSGEAMEIINHLCKRVESGSAGK